ncbi:MAG: helix-turn-helix domain-containing protein [Clostridia bacterium]|nr:helix-turn-helix domain-containing protein [Clostridia bacterium]MBR4443584.1 helix-turn-helix domain-containing protein [Clostridia bacterium]
MKHGMGIFRRKSEYWRYIAICLILLAITFVLLGLVLGTSYLRALNQDRTETLGNQAELAIQSLEAQEKSMHELSLKLSIQNHFRRSFLLESNYNRIEMADALRQYQSYCAIVDLFAVIYPQVNGENVVFLSNGSTTDWSLFLRRYGIDETRRQDMDAFLMKSEKGRGTLSLSGTLFFSFPIHIISNSGTDESGILLIPVRTEDCAGWIYQTASLMPEHYTLYYQDQRLISSGLPPTFSVGESGDWRIEVSVPPVSLLALLYSPSSLLSFCVCIVLLIAFVLYLAWQCYKPLRELAREYRDHSSAELPKNEFSQLRYMIAQIHTKNQALEEVVETRDLELCHYLLLMLLNNPDIPNLSQELDRAGIHFPHPLFAILTVEPAPGYEITREDISTLIQNVSDISGSEDVLRAVECDQSNHLLAVFCNIAGKERLDNIIRKLHAFLNRLPVRFLIADGPVTDFSGISASYLAALSKLKLVSDALTSGSLDVISQGTELQQTANKLVFQIECGDSQKALDELEHYMELIQQNGSDLVDHYSMMLLISDIYRLCIRMGYPLSESQLSMMLPTRSRKMIHSKLAQLIPALCSHKQQSGQLIKPTSQIVMNYLARHFCDYDISAQSISEALGIGLNRIYTIIREQTGYNLKTVLTQMRVQYAKQLLEDASLSMSAVAEKVGYNSPSYFSKVFKASVGQSPDYYRKMILSEKEGKAP